MNSTERLKILHRQEQKNRKFVCVMNDMSKTQQSRYERFIDKEKHESVQNCDKGIVLTRKNIVRQRVLKKCMRDKCEELERKQANKLFGRYQGTAMDTIAAQVEPFLEKNHPRIRRRQHIEELFHAGYEHGALIDDETIQDKVKKYFSQPLIHVFHSEDDERNQAETEVSSSFPHLSKHFYTGNRRSTPKTQSSERYETITEIPEQEETELSTKAERLFVSRKANKFMSEDIPDDISVQSEAPKINLYASTTNRDRRPITLPPIKLGTDKADKPRGHQNVNDDCITQLIGRLHRARNTREKEIKLKKEKRAKRLQAERVRRNGTAESDEHKRDKEAHIQALKDWDMYEERKNELLNSISNTRKKLVKHGDMNKGDRHGLEEGRIYLPPIKVIQRPVLLK